MAEHIFKRDTLLGVVGEALANKILAFRREFAVERYFCAENLLVVLKRDVTADHVVKEDA